MEVLMYETNNQEFDNFCGMVDQVKPNLIITRVEDYDNGLESYKANSYDFVFLNSFDDGAEKLLGYIMENNKEQKIVVLIESFECPQDFLCEDCLKTYKKQKFLKPIIQADVVKMFEENAQCGFDKCDGKFNFVRPN